MGSGDQGLGLRDYCWEIGLGVSRTRHLKIATIKRISLSPLLSPLHQHDSRRHHHAHHLLIIMW